MTEPTDSIPDRVLRHVVTFNEAVKSGDFVDFVSGFTVDGVMSFVGVPVGPFEGREAILAAYREMPPDDTMLPTSVRVEGFNDIVRFQWSRGGAGTMTLYWHNGQVAELTVVFDS